MDAVVKKRFWKLSLTLGAFWGATMFALMTDWSAVSWEMVMVNAFTFSLAGFGFGACLTWWLYLRPRQRALQDGQPLRTVDEVHHQVQLSVEATEGEVYRFLESALSKMNGAKIIERDELAGLLQSKVNGSLGDAGDTLSVVVRPLNGQVAVRISSRPEMPTVIADGGRTYRNVEHIWDALVEQFPVGDTAAPLEHQDESVEGTGEEATNNRRLSGKQATPEKAEH